MILVKYLFQILVDESNSARVLVGCKHIIIRVVLEMFCYVDCELHDSQFFFSISARTQNCYSFFFFLQLD